MTRYVVILAAFVRNAVTRELSFRANFLITAVTRGMYLFTQLFLFEVIYRNVGDLRGWSREEYFAFMATGLLVNSLVEALFMPNCAHFSELIRKGDLDFVLVKPADPQFLISFERLEVALFSQTLLAFGLLAYALNGPDAWPALATAEGLVRVGLYFVLVGCAVAFFYGLMIVLAATSVHFGRNQSVYDFWFYVTVFARYPRDVYRGLPLSDLVLFGCSYVFPVLLVVTTPAATLAKGATEPAFLAMCLLAAAGSLVGSRAVFLWSLRHYRSASS
ncbi:MAG: ABC-2 family transporter protein [Planctomycetota bacterium]